MIGRPIFKTVILFYSNESQLRPYRRFLDVKDTNSTMSNQ